VRQFFLETDPADLPTAGRIVSLDKEEGHHLATVLRGGRDEILHLTDGRGHRATARPVAGTKGQLEILTFADDPDELAGPRLTLACAVVKGKRFEWMLEKAVELGVHAIVPLVTRHGVIDPRQGKQARWGSLLKAALKQSGRSWLPHLAETVALDRFLSESTGAVRLFGAVPAELPAPSWTTLLPEAPTPRPEDIAVLVGPEGGWSAGERDLMVAAGVQPVGLGPHILRTETAAVAGLVAAQSLRTAWRTPSP